MTLHVNQDGTWQEAERAYVRRNGLWKPVRQAWVKRSGVWEKAFEFDNTPPSIPILSVQSEPQLRWLRISAKSPEASNQEEIAAMRVMISRKGYPANHLSGWYATTPDNNYPWEPWSDWYFNGMKINRYGSVSESSQYHANTAVDYWKEFPINPTWQTQIERGVTFYMRAWAFDRFGNVSDFSQNSFTVPKHDVDSRLSRSARFTPTESGTWTFTPPSTNEYDSNVLRVDSEPTRRVVFYYGNQIRDRIGTDPNKIDIWTMAVKLSRPADDIGAQTANISMFWHSDAVPMSQEDVNEAVFTNVTLSKGETKWVAVPEQYYGDLISNDIKGIGLFERIPANAGSLPTDRYTLRGQDPDTLVHFSGEMWIKWVR